MGWFIHSRGFAGFCSLEVHGPTQPVRGSRLVREPPPTGEEGEYSYILAILWGGKTPTLLFRQRDVYQNIGNLDFSWDWRRTVLGTWKECTLLADRVHVGMTVEMLTEKYAECIQSPIRWDPHSLIIIS